MSDRTGIARRAFLTVAPLAVGLAAAAEIPTAPRSGVYWSGWQRCQYSTRIVGFYLFRLPNKLTRVSQARREWNPEFGLETRVETFDNWPGADFLIYDELFIEDALERGFKSGTFNEAEFDRVFAKEKRDALDRLTRSFQDA